MTAQVADHLRLSDFDYDLPDSLIAQVPSPVRDRSRLLVLSRGSQKIEHHLFSALGNFLVPGDLLVLNDTRVFPCRLLARKPGGGRAEIFLLAERGLNLWQVLVKGGIPAGKRLFIDSGISAEILLDNIDGTREVRFYGVDDIRTVLPAIGRTPLPPYIKRDASQADQERYQTVYAAHEGAVAAPTAGLHFTHDLLERLMGIGVEVVTLTLHVGPGTFQPVRAELIQEHRMLPERYEVTPCAADAINLARKQGRRIIAVGTTSVRVLETASDDAGMVVPGKGVSALFIYPGYRFKATDGLVTNFHLPKSTLLMLVSAFAGRERILAAYRAAVEERYRFYSYGDAMLIV